MHKITADQVIELLNLKPLPEDTGFYHETYRSKEIIPAAVLPKRYQQGDRCFGTNIYYLLKTGMKSNLHRMKSDESWCFHLGNPLEFVQISERGELTKIILGNDLLAGQRPQHVVFAGNWFGATPMVGGFDFSLISAPVFPGFEFADFELGSRDQLIKQFPKLSEVITRFTSF